MASTRSVLAGALVAALAPLATGCSLLGPGADETESVPTSLDPGVSMTPAGEGLARGRGLGGHAPAYDLHGRVDPSTGAVEGEVAASLPVDRDARTVSLRYFAGLPELHAKPRVGEVTVDGHVVDSHREDAVIHVPLPDGHPSRVELAVPFSYTLPEATSGSILDALGGMGGPADVGLLSRHDGILNLGHWFPLWIPAGNSADPDPSGFGDIGNFPAAMISAELSVPDGWTVVDGGVQTGTASSGGRTTVTTEGYGVRDLVVSVLHGYTSKQRELSGSLDGVTVTAYGPADSAAELDGVLTETATALEALSADLVEYPWREYDVVAAPLGSGVAGMEWPGATWIEATLFAGGIPGLDGLEGLLGDGDLEELLGGHGAEGLVSGMRRWTIAHEVGHEWWNVLVGNDSILDPAVDEPLAQHAACLVLRSTGSADGPGGCRANIDASYQQMRMMGGSDGPTAGRSTGDFASAIQYSGLVYGKAAAFYLALEDEAGKDAVVEALSAIVRAHAFGMVTTEQLDDALARELEGELGRDDGFERLWHRWMEGSHGDEDLDVSGDGGGPGALADLLGDTTGSIS